MSQHLIGGRPRGSSQTQLQIPKSFGWRLNDGRGARIARCQDNAAPLRGLRLRRSSPGVILIPVGVTIGDAIEELLTMWLSWSAEDMESQIWWLSG
jgi:hypothetical protein